MATPAKTPFFDDRPPMAAEVEAIMRQRTWLTERHTEAIRASLLNDAPPAVTAVSNHDQGLRLSVHTRYGKTRYVYVLPHARGWSVFASPLPDRHVFHWRYEPKPYNSKQQPVFVPKDKTGPWYAPVVDVVRAALYVVNELHPAPVKEVPDGSATTHDPAV